MVIRVRKTRRPDSRVESRRVAFNNNGDEHARFSAGRFIEAILRASISASYFVRYFGGETSWPSGIPESNPLPAPPDYNLPRAAHNFTRLARRN